MNNNYIKILAQKVSVLLILFISTRASGLANSNYILVLSLIYTIIIAIIYNVYITNSFKSFSAIFLLLVIENYFTLGESFDITRYLKLFSVILIAYITIKFTAQNFIIHYINLVTLFLIISLPLYLWQNISSESLLSISQVLYNFSPEIFAKSEDFAPSILIYTIESVETFRNSGPMWEPGGFAAILALALYFELLINHISLTKRSIFLILGIISTFSTTGFILTGIILLNFLYNKSFTFSTNVKYFYRGLIFPSICIIFIVAFYQSNILYKKISHEYESQMWTIDNIHLYKDSNEASNKLKSLGRFGSLYLDLESLKESPLFGRGYSDGHYRSEFSEFNFTNGLSNYVGRLGLIGFIWLLVSTFKSEKQINIDHRINGKRLNILNFLILITSFSNPVLFTPLYIALQIYFLKGSKPLIVKKSKYVIPTLHKVSLSYE